MEEYTLKEFLELTPSGKLLAIRDMQAFPPNVISANKDLNVLNLRQVYGWY